MIVQAIVLGAFFGFALYFVGGHLPSRIKGMLIFQDFTLMKSIFFAIGMASSLLAISQWIGVFDQTHLSVKEMHLGVILGGVIFGIGFSLGGTCPGTCLAAMGGTRSYKKGLFAFLGGLIGALAFNLTYGKLLAFGIFDQLNLGKVTLFQISDKFPSLLPIGYPGLLVFGILFMLIASVLPSYRVPNSLRTE